MSIISKTYNQFVSVYETNADYLRCKTGRISLNELIATTTIAIERIMLCGGSESERQRAQSVTCRRFNITADS